MTPEQSQQVKGLLETYPERVVYAAVNDQTAEFRAGVALSMTGPIRLTRDGWRIVLLSSMQNRREVKDNAKREANQG